MEEVPIYFDDLLIKQVYILSPMELSKRPHLLSGRLAESGTPGNLNPKQQFPFHVPFACPFDSHVFLVGGNFILQKFGAWLAFGARLG